MDAIYAAEEKRRREREQAEQEELDKINESLKDL